MKVKKYRGIERLKSRYGMLFVAPWVFGLAVFFIYPLFKSVQFAFSDISLLDNALATEFVGLRNFNYALFEDPNYVNQLISGISSFFYSFPLILIFSMIMAVILNQEFKFRTLFRGISFLPVIVASGVIMKLIFQARGDDVISAGVESSIMEGMIDINGLITMIGLPLQLGEFFGNILNSIMTIVWSSGIQTLLFIAGLQSIPDSMYEVSKVEGATKWEEFWFITFPMLSRVTVLVSVFTMVDLFTSNNDPVMKQAYYMMRSQNYNQSTAMLWIYFLIVGIIMAVIITAFQRICIKHWE